MTADEPSGRRLSQAIRHQAHQGSCDNRPVNRRRLLHHHWRLLTFAETFAKNAKDDEVLLYDEYVVTGASRHTKIKCMRTIIMLR